MTLKLAGIPEAISGGICPFPSVEACCNAAILTIQSGIPIARIELLDPVQVRAVQPLFQAQPARRRRCCSWSFHGTEAGVAEQSERFGEIAAELGGGPFEWTTQAGGADQALGGAPQRGVLRASCCGRAASILATDVCVPLSRLAECVTETQRDIEASKLIAPIVGHIGDGNFHLTLLVDLQRRRRGGQCCEAFSHRLVERSLAMDGTCTGEHGVGQGKMKYLLARARRAALAAMRSIKQALRSAGHHVNPGKIVAPA